MRVLLNVRLRFWPSPTSLLSTFSQDEISTPENGRPFTSAKRNSFAPEFESSYGAPSKTWISLLHPVMSKDIQWVRLRRSLVTRRVGALSSRASIKMPFRWWNIPRNIGGPHAHYEI